MSIPFSMYTSLVEGKKSKLKKMLSLRNRKKPKENKNDDTDLIELQSARNDDDELDSISAYPLEKVAPSSSTTEPQTESNNNNSNNGISINFLANTSPNASNSETTTITTTTPPQWQKSYRSNRHSFSLKNNGKIQLINPFETETSSPTSTTPPISPSIISTSNHEETENKRKEKTEVGNSIVIPFKKKRKKHRKSTTRIPSEGKSLMIFGPNHPVRRWTKSMVENKYYEWIILLFILASSISLAVSSNGILRFNYSLFYTH